MYLMLTQYSTSASIIKLILLLIVFAGVLFLSYYFTKWYAKSGLVKKKTRNIEIEESYQLSPGKVIYIVRIGEKHVSFISSKDNVVKLTEVTEDELDFTVEDNVVEGVSFKDAITKAASSMKKKNK